MQAILITLYVLVALLLIGTVLIQQPKNSAGLFSGSGQSLLGTSGKNFMTRFTTGLAALFMILCLALAILPHTQDPKSSVADLVEKQQQAADKAAAQSAAQAANQAVSAPGSTGVAPSQGAPVPPAAEVPAKGKASK